MLTLTVSTTPEFVSLCGPKTNNTVEIELLLEAKATFDIFCCFWTPMPGGKYVYVNFPAGSTSQMITIPLGQNESLYAGVTAENFAEGAWQQFFSDNKPGKISCGKVGDGGQSVIIVDGGTVGSKRSQVD